MDSPVDSSFLRCNYRTPFLLCTLTSQLTSESSSPPSKGSVFSYSIISILGFHPPVGHPLEEKPNSLMAQHDQLKIPAIEYERSLEKNSCKIILLWGIEVLCCTENTCVLIMDFSFFPSEEIWARPVTKQDLESLLH